MLLALAPAGAHASQPRTARSTLDAARTVQAECTGGPLSGPGVSSKRISADVPSIISARLSGGSGDWDLAVIDAASGRVVAGSAFAGADEIAEGFTPPGDLIVQACRRSGTGSVELETTLSPLPTPAQTPVLKLVRVSTPDDASVARLTSLGLDVTESGGPGYVDVLLHGVGDQSLLGDNGFAYDVLVDDLARQSIADRRADRRAAKAKAPSGLPSGRTGTYRRLFDYSEEMRALARKNPGRVRYFTLREKTYEGRPVEAIEIAPHVKRRDGRPTFLLMGAHHAREWPSAEHTIEFAYQLLADLKAHKRSTSRLLRRSRVVFVPVVNPDGFNTSREAGEMGGAGGGRGGPMEEANLPIPYEYQRKNCRIEPPADPPSGDCSQAASTGLAQFGVDPNRNYGGFWGGPGASAEDTQPFGSLAQDYRGPGPFSEPETRNIRRLISRRQVTTLITNHTFSDLVLRPPGIQSQGPPPDEKIYKRLGDAMARENGFTSQRSYELYDTTGSAEDWSYYATGGLGFTFEIGLTNFHPPYADAIAEYDGTAPESGEGDGNQAAYMKALRSTVNRKRHSVIAGRAPAGRILTIRKTFKTPTSRVVDGAGVEGKRIRFRDRLRSSIKVPRSGRFTWDVNPSTRPLALDKGQKKRKGKPSDPIEFSGDATTATPCGDAETETPSCWNDHPFTVPGGKGIDNGKATVRISWSLPASDWDLKVYRDSDGDGSSEGEGEPLGVSASGPSSSEETTISRPGLRKGKYVVRVVNFAGVEPYDGRIVFGKTQGPVVRPHIERWKLSCRKPGSKKALVKRKVRVDRGDRARLNLARACRG